MPDILHLVRIRAPVETVYGAITDQEGLRSWWTAETIAEPEVGSIAEFKFGERYHNKMRITKLDPCKAVEWVCIQAHEEWVGTRLTFDLEQMEDKVVLRFGHRDWRETTDYLANCNYNWGLYMKSLKSYCETGQGDPFVADG
jgi:uncharacterized protein YndB with AHSA1/START domain